MWELASKGITDVDFHISGAMTRPSSPNDLMFPTATPATPASMIVANMFTLMPYENSLVVLSMNGPQLKAVLERAYRNYYYYKYVPGYGGYSYYTTCMIDINSGGKITYNDLNPTLPNGNNVVSLEFKAGDTIKSVDFTDATKYYNVSTVNYLAAGSCNFNDGGVSLWPLDKIVHDTQYYVRDAVIDYATAMGTIGPVVEGRLNFITDATPPTITIISPTAPKYLHDKDVVLTFKAIDDVSGIKKVWAELDGNLVELKQVPGDETSWTHTFTPYDLTIGDHTILVHAMDKAYNESSATVTFNVYASVQSLKDTMYRLYNEGNFSKAPIYKNLYNKLDLAQADLLKKQNKLAINHLTAFINEVKAQSGKSIKADAANLLITDAQWVIASLK